MVCPYCSTDNRDIAKFCINCGRYISQTDNSSSTKDNVQPSKETNVPKMSSTKLVPAKCTNCGATLTLDPSKDAGICPFCNSAFIVDKAINNYNTYNINNTYNTKNDYTIHEYKADNEWTYKSEKVKADKEKNDAEFAIIAIFLMIVFYLIFTFSFH